MKTTLTLSQAISMVDPEEVIFYDYLVVKECNCGDFEVLEDHNLMLELDYIDRALPVTRIDEDLSAFVYVKEQFSCESCLHVYEFPVELAAYESFINHICGRYGIPVPKFFIDDYILRGSTAGSFNSREYSVYIRRSSLRFSVITLADILMHELRHAWQSVNYPDMMEHHGIEYYDRDCEKDAYNFVAEFGECLVHDYCCKYYADELFQKYSLHRYRANNDIGERHLALVRSLSNKDTYLEPLHAKRV